MHTLTGKGYRLWKSLWKLWITFCRKNYEKIYGNLNKKEKPVRVPGQALF